MAVVVLGGGSRTCGENCSRSSLDLPGRQEELLRAVEATGKPTVLVMINGRPNSINWADAHVDAIVEAWYPGAHGGQAVYEVLFGEYNPGGKLTVTFPRHVGQIAPSISRTNLRPIPTADSRRAPAATRPVSTGRCMISATG